MNDLEKEINSAIEEFKENKNFFNSSFTDLYESVDMIQFLNTDQGIGNEDDKIIDTALNEKLIKIYKELSKIDKLINKSKLTINKYFK